MKKLLQRILSGVMSVVTMTLIMASPVAAMVYAAELLETNQHVSVADHLLRTDLKLNSSYEQERTKKNPGHLESPVIWDEKEGKINENKTLD